jgi:ribosomal protein S18 acetylase RimI-like enzyme
MRVRLAIQTNVPGVASILAQSFLEYRRSHTEKAFAATISTLGELRDRLTEGPLWVAVEGETVVGTVSGVPDGKALHIRSLAVLPGSRGQGLGELLLRQAEDYAYEQGYTRLILSTTPFLTPAIRLYERCGFRRTNEGPTDRLGTPIFTMTKQLGSRRDATSSRKSAWPD